MAVSLVHVAADGAQNEVSLSRPVSLIGRQTDCQIRIPTSDVSRHHAELKVGEGRPVVRDLGSSNGTYVNGKRIEQAELGAGDVITFGSTIFVIRIDGIPDEVDSEEALEDGTILPTGASPAAGAPTAKTTQQPAPRPVQPKAPAAAQKPPAPGSDDSSVVDFDFLDEGDIEDDQPKL